VIEDISPNLDVSRGRGVTRGGGERMISLTRYEIIAKVLTGECCRAWRRVDGPRTGVNPRARFWTNREELKDYRGGGKKNLEQVQVSGIKKR